MPEFSEWRISLLALLLGRRCSGTIQWVSGLLLHLVIAALGYWTCRVLTGELWAALRAWKLTVSRASARLPVMVARNSHQGWDALYSYCDNQRCMNNAASGRAIAQARRTSPMISLVRSRQMLKTEEPSTLRIPISRLRCSAV